MPSRRSPLALAVLSLVCEEPMHAYRMQQMIKERHQDAVVNVAQRNSVYQTIERLLRDGLIAVGETAREVNRPERTVYEPTELGRATLKQWMRTMLSTPAREFPEFPAALAFLPVIPPDEACAALEQRLSMVTAGLTVLEAEIAEGTTFLDPLFQVESEYQRALLKAEIGFLGGLVEDLRAKRLDWDFRL